MRFVVIGAVVMTVVGFYVGSVVDPFFEARSSLANVALTLLVTICAGAVGMQIGLWWLRRRR